MRAVRRWLCGALVSARHAAFLAQEWLLGSHSCVRKRDLPLRLLPRPRVSPPVGHVSRHHSAERVGFEPTDPHGSTTFKAVAFVRSATAPGSKCRVVARKYVSPIAHGTQRRPQCHRGPPIERPRGTEKHRVDRFQVHGTSHRCATSSAQTRASATAPSHVLSSTDCDPNSHRLGQRLMQMLPVSSGSWVRTSPAPTCEVVRHRGHRHGAAGTRATGRNAPTSLPDRAAQPVDPLAGGVPAGLGLTASGGSVLAGGRVGAEELHVLDL
jgi:hypothetical protein